MQVLLSAKLFDMYEPLMWAKPGRDGNSIKLSMLLPFPFLNFVLKLLLYWYIGKYNFTFISGTKVSLPVTVAAAFI